MSTTIWRESDDAYSIGWAHSRGTSFTLDGRSSCVLSLNNGKWMRSCDVMTCIYEKNLNIQTSSMPVKVEFINE